MTNNKIMLHYYKISLGRREHDRNKKIRISLGKKTKVNNFRKIKLASFIAFA